MRNKNNLIFLTGVFLVLFNSHKIEAGEENILLQISQANEFYHEKEYQSAANIFEGLVSQGQHSGYLYYNLGNTYMRLGETGSAILNYLHAKKILPRDESLDANLRNAISQTVDQLPPQIPILHGLLFWIEAMSLIEHIQLLIIINIVFWSVSIGLTYYRKPSWNMLKNITLGVLLIISFSTGIKYYSSIKQKYGVVLISKVDIKSDRSINDITLFQLHEGAIISINQEEENWIQVSLDKDKSGWVQKKTIGF